MSNLSKKGKGFGKGKANENNSHYNTKDLTLVYANLTNDKGIYIDLANAKKHYTAHPELIHYHMNMWKEFQIATGERVLFGVDLTTEEGYKEGVERLVSLVFGQGGSN